MAACTDTPSQESERTTLSRGQRKRQDRTGKSFKNYGVSLDLRSLPIGSVVVALKDLFATPSGCHCLLLRVLVKVSSELSLLSRSFFTQTKMSVTC